MEGFGPDAVDEEELKRAKLWRDIRAELTRGVKPHWDGNSARNTREWKASLEQKLAQKIVPGAVNGLLLAVYDGGHMVHLVWADSKKLVALVLLGYYAKAVEFRIISTKAMSRQWVSA